MLKISIADPTTVQGEQLRTELKANGLITEIRAVEVMDAGTRDPNTGVVTRNSLGWQLHFIDLDASSEATVRSAIAAHQPNRQYGWSAADRARAADDDKVRAVMAKQNPTPQENRDAIAILAKRLGIV